MSCQLPVRAPLARLPTPLERLARLGAIQDLDLWIKRDDLTGTAISGNKVRKLEFLVAAALQRRADLLITCGAVNSNHARATAVAAARLGLRSHLVLRGDEPDLPDGNLLLDRMLGARTTFITHAEWPNRDAIMDEIAARHAATGGAAYAIPEGGSNGLGCLGYVVCAQELLEQERLEGLEIRRVVHATGSGGTTAGLALGMAAAGRDDVEVIGVAVCDDRAYFDARVGGICDEAVELGAVSADVRARARWTIAEGYQGEGYGLTTPPELEDIAEVARREGVLLDPVYSGKAWRGLLGEVGAGRTSRNGTTVFLHTGGIFGLYAFRREIGQLPPA